MRGIRRIYFIYFVYIIRVLFTFQLTLLNLVYEYQFFKLINNIVRANLTSLVRILAIVQHFIFIQHYIGLHENIIMHCVSHRNLYELCNMVIFYPRSCKKRFINLILTFNISYIIALRLIRKLTNGFISPSLATFCASKSSFLYTSSWIQTFIYILMFNFLYSNFFKMHIDPKFLPHLKDMSRII